MQSISVSLTAVVLLAMIALLVAAVAVPVEIVETIRIVDAVPPGGKIMGIQEMPHLSITTHEAEEDRRFQFTRDSEGPLVIHTMNRGRSHTEHVSNAVTKRVITMNFTLPLDQSMQVRVVDAEGNAFRHRLPILCLALSWRIPDSEAQQERQQDQLDVIENRMARTEGALFYGPPAIWTMENRREKSETDPKVRKGL